MPTKHNRPHPAVPISVSALGLLTLSGIAFAQNPPAPAFQYEKPPEKPEDWKVQAKGGLLITGGNSQVTNGVVGVTAARKSGDNKVSFEGQGAYARSSVLTPNLDVAGTIVGYGRTTQTTANAWMTRGRYDRFLTNNNALYGLGQIGADRIAGKRLYGGAQIGYSRQLWKDDRNATVAEIGYDFSAESYLSQPGKTLDPVTIHSLRLFAGELLSLTPQTGLSASAEALFNLNAEKALDASDPTGATSEVKSFRDTRLVGKLGLTTVLWKNLSLGVGFTVKYDQNPAPRPIPASAGAARYAAGFQAFSDKVDTLTEANLVVTFL